jgi:NAD(P)-dependent dehydrogenase (short-subunit alcohol dehydrogenase family)
MARALDGQVAVVTGAGSGIGAAAAVRLAEAGARVVLASRTAEELQAVQAEIEAGGGEALSIVTDVGDPAQIEAMYHAALTRWGRLDIVFANAGINGVWAPLEEITLEEWDEVLRINLTGTFLTIQRALPHLKATGGGSIIVTSSVNGTRVFSSGGASAYATTKAGQVALTKMLAVELGPHHIRINVICPGAIVSEIEDNTEKRHVEQASIPAEYPAGPIPLTGKERGSADETAELVLFLASAASQFITGTEVWIDGGESLLKG